MNGSDKLGVPLPAIDWSGVIQLGKNRDKHLDIMKRFIESNGKRLEDQEAMQAAKMRLILRGIYGS